MFTKMLAVLTFALPMSAFATSAPVWSSVYTDLSKDCVVVSSANATAEIDFYDAECKAFGGYQLNIDGGDLRYGPSLRYNDIQIDMGRPGAFHDMGSTKVEWVFSKTTELDGSGAIEWKAFIYRLSVANESGTSDSSILYVVRLNKVGSCPIGTATTNVAARALAYDLAAPCL